MAERKPNGQFKKGHSGGPGRPKKTREERYYEIAVSTVTFKDWEQIIKKAAEQAKRGDYQARKWLSDYLAPQSQKHEITTDGPPLINLDM